MHIKPAVDFLPGARLMATVLVSVAEALDAIANAAPFDPDDDVTLADHEAAISAMSDVTLAALQAINVDTIHSTTDFPLLGPTQLGSLGSVALTAADVVLVAGTSAELEGLDPAALAAQNVDGLSAIGPVTL